MQIDFFKCLNCGGAEIQIYEKNCVCCQCKTEYPLECAELILAGVQFLTDKGFYPWTFPGARNEHTRNRRAPAPKGPSLTPERTGAAKFVSGRS